jgi:hypothetical protein
VLLCFGSKGCLLVPRSSSTSVAAWCWPTWVVSRRRVLEAVFVLLESPSHSRRIFIGSHSLPPLWFAASVLQIYPTRLQSTRMLVVWTSLGPLPRRVLGPTTWWAPGTTRLGLHGTCWCEAQGPWWRSTRIGSYACPVPCRELLDVHN